MSSCSGILAAFGRELTVSCGKETIVSRGIISPLNAKKTDKTRELLPAGLDVDLRYFLICDAAALPDAEPGRKIGIGGAEYELLRAEPVYFGAELSHWEAVLRFLRRWDDA